MGFKLQVTLIYIFTNYTNKLLLLLPSTSTDIFDVHKAED